MSFSSQKRITDGYTSLLERDQEREINKDNSRPENGKKVSYNDICLYFKLGRCYTNPFKR